MMTKTERPGMGEGERLHAERRWRFWRIIIGLAVLGMVTGFASGFFVGVSDARQLTAEPLYRTVGAIGAILMAILFAVASWRFFAVVDEVEMADNLWGSLIGFYAYAISFPLWWALWKLDRAPEPDDWIIFEIALVTAIIAYAVRKWRSN